MPQLKIPTPLRPYAGGHAVVDVKGQRIAEILQDLTQQHPGLKQHLFSENGDLRPFVNLFVNDEDIRYLSGVDTPIEESDQLRIIPSIAGGLTTPAPSGIEEVSLRKVDHGALKTNQMVIITLSILAFILNQPLLALLVGLMMAMGTIFGVPGFGFLYRRLLRPLNLVQADILDDNPEPHRFAQGFGALVTLGGGFALLLGAPALGWGLVWLVVALAALNLFAGFCVGCAVYYWLVRLQVPGFVKPPPPDTLPGMRPGR